ncbi:hypothetical protein DES53_111171 [Roseimicrobium gellanilyticum]|uniref:Uncharacterized protein n=1 Tax=Roseimicrobium gellanilyticum TaxID=748857 RepID=A0A366HAZ0_9BACT|nr:hypothetical protein [Roseimicrobium gellanilyticum]RBP38651.1 hypothetical protein DES53_111171 [Roseimicrobium gellanilyticum]
MDTNNNLKMPSDILDLVLAEWSANHIEWETAPPSQAFLVRAGEAARNGNAIRLMRNAVSELGFSPVPLPDYVATVANKARVNLGKIMPIAEAGASSATPWVQVAAKLGMAADRIALHLRLWVADRFAVLEPAPALVAHRGKASKEASVSLVFHGMDEQAASEALNRLESQYPPHARELLTSCLAALEDAPR